MCVSASRACVTLCYLVPLDFSGLDRNWEWSTLMSLRFCWLCILQNASQKVFLEIYLARDLGVGEPQRQAATPTTAYYGDIPWKTCITVFPVKPGPTAVNVGDCKLLPCVHIGPLPLTTLPMLTGEGVGSANAGQSAGDIMFNSAIQGILSPT